MTVEIYKLITGDEIIGSVVEKTPTRVTITSPRVMQMYHTERGVSAGLVPWILSSPDGEVTIKNDHIVADLACPIDVETSYLQQTSKLDLTSKFQI